MPDNPRENPPDQKDDRLRRQKEAEKGGTEKKSSWNQKAAESQRDPEKKAPGEGKSPDRKGPGDGKGSGTQDGPALTWNGRDVAYRKGREADGAAGGGGSAAKDRDRSKQPPGRTADNRKETPSLNDASIARTRKDASGLAGKRPGDLGAARRIAEEWSKPAVLKFQKGSLLHEQVKNLTPDDIVLHPGMGGVDPSEKVGDLYRERAKALEKAGKKDEARQLTSLANLFKSLPGGDAGSKEPGKVDKDSGQGKRASQPAGKGAGDAVRVVGKDVPDVGAGKKADKKQDVTTRPADRVDPVVKAVGEILKVLNPTNAESALLAYIDTKGGGKLKYKVSIRGANVFVTDAQGKPLKHYRRDGNFTNLPEGHIYFSRADKRVFERLSDGQNFKMGQPGALAQVTVGDQKYDVFLVPHGTGIHGDVMRFINPPGKGTTGDVKDLKDLTSRGLSAIHVLADNPAVVRMSEADKVALVFNHALSRGKAWTRELKEMSKAFTSLEGIAQLAAMAVSGSAGMMLLGMVSAKELGEAVNIARHAKSVTELAYASRIVSREAVGQIVGIAMWGAGHGVSAGLRLRGIKKGQIINPKDVPVYDPLKAVTGDGGGLAGRVANAGGGKSVPSGKGGRRDAPSDLGFRPTDRAGDAGRAGSRAAPDGPVDPYAKTEPLKAGPGDGVRPRVDPDKTRPPAVVVDRRASGSAATDVPGGTGKRSSKGAADGPAGKGSSSDSGRAPSTDIPVTLEKWGEGISGWLGRTAAEVTANEAVLQQVGYTRALMEQKIGLVRSAAKRLGLGDDAVRAHFQAEAELYRIIQTRHPEAAKGLRNWLRSEPWYGPESVLRMFEENRQFQDAWNKLPDRVKGTDAGLFRAMVQRGDKAAKVYVDGVIKSLNDRGLKTIQVKAQDMPPIARKIFLEQDPFTFKDFGLGGDGGKAPAPGGTPRGRPPAPSGSPRGRGTTQPPIAPDAPAAGKGSGKAGDTLPVKDSLPFSDTVKVSDTAQITNRVAGKDTAKAGDTVRITNQAAKDTVKVGDTTRITNQVAGKETVKVGDTARITDAVTAESLRQADRRFDKIQKQVTDRKRADLQDGFKHSIDPKDKVIRQYADEHGVVMHIPKNQDPFKTLLQVIEKYPEREWELIRNLESNEYLLVHGDGNFTWGDVGISTIRSEFKGQKLQSIGHYHPRKGQLDYLAIFPSEADYIYYFDNKVLGEGVLHQIFYRDYRTGRMEGTYITRLPSSYDKVGASARKLLESVFGGPPKTGSPYVMVYKNPMTGKLTGKQFKTLAELDVFARAESGRFADQHRRIVGTGKSGR